jgi:hypothetical protein
MKIRTAGAAIIVFVLAGCVRTTLFERYVADQNWIAAAREFTADSSLISNERTLYQAGVVFGTPGLPTYQPVKSRELLNTLIARFPESPHRWDATARLLLIDEVFRMEKTAAARERELEARIATLTRETRELRARIDSATAQGDSLRTSVSRLEAERRDKDEQIKALRLELQRLKEIDLKPRAPTRPPLRR